MGLRWGRADPGGRAPGGCRVGTFWSPTLSVSASPRRPHPQPTGGQREAGLSGASSQDAAGLPDPGKASRPQFNYHLPR